MDEATKRRLLTPHTEPALSRSELTAAQVADVCQQPRLAQECADQELVRLPGGKPVHGKVRLPDEFWAEVRSRFPRVDDHYLALTAEEFEE